MLRVLAIAAMFAFAVPTLAAAQGNEHHEKGPPGRPGGAKPFVQHKGPAGPVGGAHVGGMHPVGAGVRQFSYRGHMVNRVHLSPFAYPRGYAYRRWAVGAALPAVFLGSAYYYSEWAALGLASPEPGFQWVRYGPDLLLVNVTTGQVADVAYGVIY